jgi:mono/diheme cytochrome c family protein
MPRLSRAFSLSLLLVASAAAACKRKEVAQDTHAEAQQLFDSVCATCHGRDGRGGVPSAEGQPPPRNFCDAAFQASRSDVELKQSIRSGKGPMPPFGALFDDEQLSLLVGYIRGFNPKK